MLRRAFINSSVINQIRHVSQSTPKQKYDIFAGALIERMPVIAKDFSELEKEFSKLLSQIEFENSLKSDHELRKEKERRQQELIKKGKIDQDNDSEARTLQTAQDFQDLCQDELSKFKFSQRTTEADMSNDLMSVNRKLDETLMLVCNHKFGKNDLFLLPQDKWIEGESLRQTAERIVSQRFGSMLKVNFYGNAPVGFYKYKYPQEERKDAVGAKVFFFRAMYSGGTINEKNADYKWINEEELKLSVRDSYYHAVSQFLV